MLVVQQSRLKDFFMKDTTFIKAQQKIYELDIDSNAQSLILLLTVISIQNGNGDEEFNLTVKEIMRFLSIKDKYRIINARNVLVDKGMINYTKGKKGVKSTYRVNWNKIINNI